MYINRLYMSRWFDATINSLFTTNKYKKNENKKKERKNGENK